MITQPYPNFIRPDAGGNVKPISNGLIYIGKEGLDPVSNPIDVFYIDNAGTEQKIDQPIHLNSTGITVAGENDGTIILPYAKTSVYSILITDKIGDPKYTDLTSTGYINGNELNDAIEKSQGEIFGGSLFKGSNGSYVQDTDIAPTGTTHFSVQIDGKAEIVEICPSASGQISDLTEFGAMVGTTQVVFLETGDTHSRFSELESDASLNYQTAICAINTGRKIKLKNDAYFSVLGQVAENDILITGQKRPKMKFVGSGTFFKMKDGLSVYNTGIDYAVESGESVKYFDYENEDGKLNTAWFTQFKIDGSLQLVNPSTGLDLDPTVEDFGIDHIVIESGNTQNMVSQLCLINSTPYKTCHVKDVHGKNNKLLTVSNPVQNGHPFYSKIQLSMQSLVVDNVTLENDRGFLAESAGGSYAGIVLWEGRKAVVNNTRCEGVVTSDGTPVYDFYMAGIDASTSGCIMKDCYAFNYNGNTPLKIKKVENCDAERKRATFSKDFFDYWKDNHNLLLSNSGGNPWTIDLESIGGDYSIDNCHLVCPYVATNGRQKATQKMASFSLTGSKVVVESGVAPYIAAMEWSDELKESSKFLAIKDTVFDINTDDAFYLAKMDIDKGTPDGGFIDLSGNTIRAKGGVYELLITTSDSDNKDTTLDFIKVGNKVYTEGNYQQIKNFCKLPTVKNTDFSGSQLQMNTTGNEIFYGSNPMGDGASSGDFKHVQKGTPGRVGAIAFHRPQSSKVSAGRVLINGQAKYDEVVRNFNTYIDIAPNELNNTIDITIPVLAGGVQTITWSGVSGTITYLDLGHGIDEPFVMIMRRTDSYVYFSLEYRSGKEPSYSSLKWDYSAL